MGHNETELHFDEWLQRYLAGALPLLTRHAEAWWRVNTAGGKDSEKELGQSEEALRRYLADADRYAALKKIPRQQIEAPLPARQYDVLRNYLERHQTDETILRRLVALLVEVESEYTKFRSTLDGKEVADNELKEILRKTSDSESARAAWEASKQIGPRVAERVLELVELRNQSARALGYDNFHEMSLTLKELPPESLFQLLERLADATLEPFREIKADFDSRLARKFGIAASELRPWHYGDPFFQSTPQTGEVDLDQFYAGKDLEQLTRRFYTGIGLDIDDVLGRSDLYERQGKCQHAFCTHIDRCGDVRVLCNLRGDEQWMATMLHEFGHAVYDKYLDMDMPISLRQPAHTLTTEAIAMLFGRLSQHSDFLVKIAGIERDEADAVASRAREELRRNELVFVRWALVVVRFEQELYRDPGQDLNGLWWSLVEKYQELTPPEGRDTPDWAAKIHIATVPVYYQNYVLGELTASQLQHHLLTKTLGGASSLVDQPAVGAFLRENVFLPGARYPWNELIEHATSEELDPRYFIEEFA